MRRQTFWFLIYLLLLAVVGHITVYLAVTRPKTNLSRLRLGMTKSQVHQALGYPTIIGDYTQEPDKSPFIRRSDVWDPIHKEDRAVYYETDLDCLSADVAMLRVQFDKKGKAVQYILVPDDRARLSSSK